MKHSAVLNAPSTTALVTENQNPRRQAPCTPVGLWSWMAAGMQGWEVSRGDAREDMACLWPAGYLLVQGGWGGPRTGTEVEWFRLTCFCIWPQHSSLLPGLGEKPQGWACAPHTLWVSHTWRDQLQPSHTTVFFHSQLQRKQWYKSSFSWHSYKPWHPHFFNWSQFYTNCRNHSPQKKQRGDAGCSTRTWLCFCFLWSLYQSLYFT